MASNMLRQGGEYFNKMFSVALYIQFSVLRAPDTCTGTPILQLYWRSAIRKPKLPQLRVRPEASSRLYEYSYKRVLIVILYFSLTCFRCELKLNCTVYIRYILVCRVWPCAEGARAGGRAQTSCARTAATRRSSRSIAQLLYKRRTSHSFSQNRTRNPTRLRRARRRKTRSGTAEQQIGRTSVRCRAPLVAVDSRPVAAQTQIWLALRQPARCGLSRAGASVRVASERLTDAARGSGAEAGERNEWRRAQRWPRARDKWQAHIHAASRAVHCRVRRL